MRVYPHPVLPIDLPEWWRYKAQMPPGVFLFIVPVLLGLLVPQRWMRTYLLVTSILMIWLTFGYFFLLAILGATLLGWALCLAGRWASGHGRGAARLVLLAGWVVSNAIYFSLFYLPVNRLLDGSTHLDVLLLCGPGFMLFRFLGLFCDACAGKDVGSLRPDRYALFVLFAPTFRLGPMTRYAEINRQIDTCKSRINRYNVLKGFGLILLGWVQLLIVDEVINEWLVDPYHERTFFFTRQIFAHVSSLSWLEAVAAMYMIAFRFLLGFSGYSHFAIGLCLILGIILPRNFNWPYLATNLQDFWRRWHISLGAWLRDFVYIPLGGKHRRLAATFVVFLYCFLWHQPALNMVVFAFLHTGGLAAFHGWRTWSERCPESTLCRMVSSNVSGILITFHFWCLTTLVMFDAEYCGLGMMKRIFVDPILHLAKSLA